MRSIFHFTFSTPREKRVSFESFVFRAERNFLNIVNSKKNILFRYLFFNCRMKVDEMISLMINIDLNLEYCEYRKKRCWIFSMIRVLDKVALLSRYSKLYQASKMDHQR